MLTSPADMLRRATGRVTGRLSSLPILALSVHSACNCRCVMCDIWKANANKREISIETLQGHLDAIRALGVQRVMLTGGEPLLHTNLWRFCSLLQDEGVALTLVTTGLLLERHAADIREFIDEVVVSIDGWSDTHDAIRRTPGGFTRIARGVATLRDGASRPHVIGRSVVQKANCSEVDATVQAVAAIGVDRLSFLAVDVSSSAFNRPAPWSLERKQEVGLGRDDLPRFADSIRRAEASFRGGNGRRQLAARAVQRAMDVRGPRRGRNVAAVLLSTGVCVCGGRQSRRERSAIDAQFTAVHCVPPRA